VVSGAHCWADRPRQAPSATALEKRTRVPALRRVLQPTGVGAQHTWPSAEPGKRFDSMRKVPIGVQGRAVAALYAGLADSQHTARIPFAYEKKVQPCCKATPWTSTACASGHELAPAGLAFEAVKACF